MSDRDKKVVNTEEQNRAVNPGDSPVQEDSISQDAVHDIEKSGNTQEAGEEKEKTGEGKRGTAQRRTAMEDHRHPRIACVSRLTTLVSRLFTPARSVRASRRL